LMSLFEFIWSRTILSRLDSAVPAPICEQFAHNLTTPPRRLQPDQAPPAHQPSQPRIFNTRVSCLPLIPWPQLHCACCLHRLLVPRRILHRRGLRRPPLRNRAASTLPRWPAYGLNPRTAVLLPRHVRCDRLGSCQCRALAVRGNIEKYLLHQCP